MLVNSTPVNIPAGAIETVTGRYIDVMNPSPDVIDVYDIFWALARQARFAGHTLSTEIWSVGQHSLLVTSIVYQLMHEMTHGAGEATEVFNRYCLQTWPKVECNLQTLIVDGQSANYVEQFRLEVIHFALLHDATEAYLVDLPSPIKHHSALKDVYKLMESQLNKIIMDKYGISEHNEVMNMIIRWADMYALQIEASNMMPSRGRGWQVMDTGFLPMALHLMPEVLPWKEVFKQLMHAHLELLNKRENLRVKISELHPTAREITGIS